MPDVEFFAMVEAGHARRSGIRSTDRVRPALATLSVQVGSESFELRQSHFVDRTIQLFTHRAVGCLRRNETARHIAVGNRILAPSVFEHSHDEIEDWLLDVPSVGTPPLQKAIHHNLIRRPVEHFSGVPELADDPINSNSERCLGDGIS